jgi:hypothetical protein
LPTNTQEQDEKKRQELEKAEEFARKALTAVARKPVSETKVRAVAKKVLENKGGGIGGRIVALSMGVGLLLTPPISFPIA